MANGPAAKTSAVHHLSGIESSEAARTTGKANHQDSNAETVMLNYQWCDPGWLHVNSDRMDRDAVPPCHGPPNIWCKVASVLGNVEVPIGHSIAKSLGPRNREENVDNVWEWQEMTRII